MVKIVKTLVAFLLVILMLISVCVTASAENETTFTITELEGRYKTQGRTALVNGDLMLEWSASGMVFTADCSGDVKITLNATRLKTEAHHGIYFTVFVDGKMQYEDARIPTNNSADVWTSNSTNYPFHITQKGESEFTIAKNLKSGKHTFEIYKQTEAINTTFGIRSITLKGEITAPPNNNALYIEVVGDSIAAGLGNISTGGQNAPLYQDATRGWPYLAAKALSADFSVLAQSGITATDNIGWSGASSVTMPDVYPKTMYYSDKRTEHDFARKPDIIVVCLGTNDVWTYEKCGATTITVESGFKNMLSLLREKNPEAKIIWVHGMMVNTADSLIASAVKDMGGSEKGFYTLALPKNVVGGQGHPSLSAQTLYANSLVDFIEIEILKTRTESEEIPPETNIEIDIETNTESSENSSSAEEDTSSVVIVSKPETSSSSTSSNEQADTTTIGAIDEGKDSTEPDSILIPVVIGVASLLIAGGIVFAIIFIKRKKQQ